jgi:hypothetical protein
MPGTVNAHPRVASFTVQLADKARSCDEADEMLNADIVGSLAHMWIDFSLDAKACLEKLVLMARGKS